MSTPTEPAVKRCRKSAAHEGHEWTHQARADALIAHGYPVPKRLDLAQVYICPGTEHADHAARCCTIHGAHSMPHIGCILR